MIFDYLECPLPEFCEPEFSMDYPGCDIQSFDNVPSWQRCSVICFLIPSCKAWTWSHRSIKCYLKSGKCAVTFSRNFISGEEKCGNISTIFIWDATNYGLVYEECNIKIISDVRFWEVWSQFCYLTKGCELWNYYHKRSIIVHPCSCWLKKCWIEATNYKNGILGNVST